MSASLSPRPADTDHIGCRLEDGIATVVMSNPGKKNALDLDMWGQLPPLLRWLATEPEARVVVLTGAGEDFCAGADLSGGFGGAHTMTYMRWINEVALALHALPQPTIARVDGVAVGAGLSLALACDLIITSDRARFSEIFARRALSLDLGSSWFLPRRVGLHKAKELSLLAPIIDAAEAERIGLVNRVVPVDELDAAVGEWASQLADGPPIALAGIKSLLDSSSTSTLAEALSAEAAAQAINFATDDTAESIAAFIDKREPRYRGR